METISKLEAPSSSLGEPVDNWASPLMPGPNKFMGRYSCPEILAAEKHTAEIYQAYRGHDAAWN